MALAGLRSRAGVLEIPWLVEQWLHRPTGWGLAALAVLLVYHIMEKSSTSWGFGVLMFQLSLVLYLSQGCLQPLSNISGSLSSGELWLCPGSHHPGLIIWLINCI
jgi:hypothetical protein